MKVIDADTGKELNLSLSTAEIRQDLDAFRDRECKHPQKELRRVHMRDGRPGYQDQCQVCGQLVGQYKSASLASPSTPDADTDTHPRYEAEREAEYQAILQKHVRLQRRDWDNLKDRYREYLKSEAWRRKRQKVLDRAKGICEGCGERPASQVHHLTYERAGHELLIDLAALCGECHAACHPDRDNYAGENEDYIPESPCCGCRWQACERNGLDWCGALEMPAYYAQAWDDLCKRVMEPMK